MAGISRNRTTADQSLAIDNVNSAMVTQWNAAQSEELPSMAKQLLSNAELEGMVRSFRIDEGVKRDLIRADRSPDPCSREVSTNRAG